MNLEVGDVVATNEVKLVNAVSLRREVEVIDAVGDDFPPQVDGVLLVEGFLVAQLVDLEHQFAAIDGAQGGLVVDAGERCYALLLVLGVEGRWDRDNGPEQVGDDLPDLARLFARRGHELTVLRELQVRHPRCVLVLHPHIVEELGLVELDDIEDLLRLLQLLPHLEVLHALLTSQTCLSVRNELLEDSHSFLAFAHRNEQESVQGLPLARHVEDELFHLSDELVVRDAASAPAVHAEVALGVEVAVGEEAGFTPPVERFSLLVVE